MERGAEAEMTKRAGQLLAVKDLGMFRVCGSCRKKFYISYTDVDGWKYRRQPKNGGRMKYFCSWTCMRAWDRTHPQKENHRVVGKRARWETA